MPGWRVGPTPPQSLLSPTHSLRRARGRFDFFPSNPGPPALPLECFVASCALLLLRTMVEGGISRKVHVLWVKAPWMPVLRPDRMLDLIEGLAWLAENPSSTKAERPTANRSVR